MKMRWRFWRGSPYVTEVKSRLAGKRGPVLAAVGIGVGVLALTVVAMGWWWAYEPDAFDPVAVAAASAREAGVEPVTGYTTAVTVATLAETLLNKRGGYLSNDILPPGVYLDNTPNWEFGVLTHLRVISRAMRNELSRSQSQSAEDPDLAAAEGHFHFPNDSWIFPSPRTSTAAAPNACSPTPSVWRTPKRPARSSTPAPTTSRAGWTKWRAVLAPSRCAFRRASASGSSTGT